MLPGRHVFLTIALVALCVAGSPGVLSAPTPDSPGVADLAIDKHQPEPVGHRCIHDELMALQQPLESLPMLSDSSRSSQTVKVMGASGMQSIRIGVFTLDMDDPSHYCTASGETRPDMTGGTATCSDKDVFTSAKRKLLRLYLIPHALQLHTDRLLVTPVAAISSFSLSGNVCGSFTVPAAHQSSGVSGYDLVIYAAAAPTTGGTVAWASPCLFFTNNRSAVGVVNVGPAYISTERSALRAVAHELGHVLGFSYFQFQRMGLTTKKSINGKPESEVHTGPKVITAAQEQYGCDSAAWMELEDQGGSGTQNSHWERRIAKDELMSGIIGVGFYSALTLASFEDFGFYGVDYSKAEHMEMGYQVGCDILTKKCVDDGVSIAPSLFCTSNENMINDAMCTSDFRALGVCIVESYIIALPTYYQYFYDPTISGVSSDLMDYCPYQNLVSDGSCESGSAGLLKGSVISHASRCFPSTKRGLRVMEGSSGYSMSAICAEVQCDGASETYEFRPLDGDWTACPEGANVNVVSPQFASGSVTCPSYKAVCPLDPEITGSSAWHGSSSDGALHIGWAGTLAVLQLVLLM